MSDDVVMQETDLPVSYGGDEGQEITEVFYEDGRVVTLPIPPSVFPFLITTTEEQDPASGEYVKKIIACADLSDPQLIRKLYEKDEGPFELVEMPSILSVETFGPVEP